MNRGFTFLEVILTIAIVAAVFVVGDISLSQLQEVLKVRATADEIRSMLQLARENSLAGINQATYRVSLSNNIIKLETGSGQEIDRYQPPPGISFTPANLLWSFSPPTGAISGCTLPCQLSLTSGTTTEIISITESLIVK